MRTLYSIIRAMVQQPFIWDRVNRTARKGAQLTYARIVKAAMRIAGREGLDAISIRRIAGDLKSSAMSLYRYVASKDEIFDLLLDEAFGEIAVPSAPCGDWREDLRGVARQTRVILKRHPWATALLTARPTLGPNYLRWFEFSLASLEPVGIDMRTRIRVVGVVYAYVSGVAAYESGDAATSRKHNLTEKRKRELAAPYLKRLFATGMYPHLAEFVRLSSGQSTDEDFDFGLDCVIGGLSRSIG
jgi:AcrR family transcriptional regulator